MSQPDRVVVDVLVTADGREFPLVDGLSIGRAEDAGVSLADGAISRQHAVIRRQGVRWMLSDCGSRNGTSVNDVRIPAYTDHPLRDGDRISLGPLVMRARLSSDVDDEATSSMRLRDVTAALSPYQMQVVQALAAPWLRGQEPASNADIAAALGTPRAVEAVKAALRRCYAKSGVAELPAHTKRRELCRMASERGWV